MTNGTSNPPGEDCPYCGQPILLEDVRDENIHIESGRLVHVECLLRRAYLSQPKA
jgi:hypothetical protein